MSNSEDTTTNNGEQPDADNEDQTPPFNMTAWADQWRIKRKTITAMSKEEYTDLQVLRAMEASDVASLDVTGGQARALKMGLTALGNPNFKPPSTTPTPEGEVGVIPPKETAPLTKDKAEDPAGQTGSTRAILQAGGDYEKLMQMMASAALEDPSPTSSISRGYVPPGAATGRARGGVGGYDPTMLLTLRATTKKAHLCANFVPELVKERIAKRRRETIHWEEGSDGTFSIKTEARQTPYLTAAEWGAASIRVLHHMRTEGELEDVDLTDYLTYMVVIFEFASIYDWNSILEFDVRYREAQAQSGFRWGCEAGSLQTLCLKARRTEAPGGETGAGGKRKKKKKRAPVPEGEVCKNFLHKGECEYGEDCRYEHVERK